MDYLQEFSHSIITNSRALNPWTLAVASLLFYVTLSYYNSGAWKLRKFPTVGSSLPFLSFIGTLRFAINTNNVVAAGERKWPGQLFKVSAPVGWQLVVTNPSHVDDLKKAPEHILSASKVIEEFLQTRFTLFHNYVMENQIHLLVIRTRLAKITPGLIEDIYEEVVEACNQYLPRRDEWTGIATPDMTTIAARTANRVFVGPILCKNPEWLKICIDFTIDTIKISTLLSIFPSFLRPLVNYLTGGKAARRNRAALELLKPFIAARRDAEKGEKAEHSNDFLSWLIDESKGEDREDWPVVARIFGINFAAIHTTSSAFRHALLDLASNLEYLEPLREEVEEVTKREGWTKAGLDQMHKVDSFLKESQRLHPAGILLMGRYTVTDFAFSDGTTVPAGTTLLASTTSAHLDPRAYEDPLKFDGFRFIKKKERAALDGHPDRNFDHVATHPDFVGFGQGRHSCPGRFFASAELKILLAHIVTTYDVRLVDGVRPANLFIMNGIVPNPSAKLYFRKRK